MSTTLPETNSIENKSETPAEKAVAPTVEELPKPKAVEVTKTGKPKAPFVMTEKRLRSLDSANDTRKENTRIRHSLEESYNEKSKRLREEFEELIQQVGKKKAVLAKPPVPEKEPVFKVVSVKEQEKAEKEERSKKKVKIQEEESDTEVDEPSDEEEAPAPPPAKKSKKSLYEKVVQQEASSESDSDDDEYIQFLKAQKKQRKKQARAVQVPQRVPSNNPQWGFTSRIPDDGGYNNPRYGFL